MGDKDEVEDQLKDIFQVAKVNIQDNFIESGFRLSLSRSTKSSCPRCRLLQSEVDNSLCLRCKNVLNEIETNKNIIAV